MSDSEITETAETQTIDAQNKNDKRKVIVVLESACLETVKTKKVLTFSIASDYFTTHHYSV